MSTTIIDLEVKVHRLESMLDEMTASVLEKSPTHKYLGYFQKIKETALEIQRANLKLWRENKDLGRSLANITK